MTRRNLLFGSFTMLVVVVLFQILAIRQAADEQMNVRRALQTAVKPRQALVPRIPVAAPIRETRPFQQQQQQQQQDASKREDKNNKMTKFYKDPAPTAAKDDENDGHDVKVTLVGLISMQRSSSTFLSKDILGSQTCWVNLNEILQPQRRQSADAWFVGPGRELQRGSPAVLESNSGRQYADFIAETGRRRCLEKWAELTMEGENFNAQEQCDNHCYITWKEFPHKLSLEKHQEIWTAMHRHYDFYMLILERDIQKRWRSFWYAQVTNDWNTNGDPTHKDALSNAKVPPVQDEFKWQHEAWYAMIRSFVTRSAAPPSLEMRYEDVTSRKSVQEMQQNVDNFIRKRKQVGSTRH